MMLLSYSPNEINSLGEYDSLQSISGINSYSEENDGDPMQIGSRFYRASRSVSAKI